LKVLCEKAFKKHLRKSALSFGLACPELAEGFSPDASGQRK
jgi:hypothetical protein